MSSTEIKRMVIDVDSFLADLSAVEIGVYHPFLSLIFTPSLTHFLLTLLCCFHSSSFSVLLHNTGSEEETEIVKSALTAHLGSTMLVIMSKVSLGRLIAIRLQHARGGEEWASYKQWLLDRGISTPLANECIRTSSLFGSMPTIIFHSRMSRILNCFKSFIALIAKNPSDWEVLGTDLNGVVFALGKGSNGKTLPRIKAAPMQLLLGGDAKVRDAALFSLKKEVKPNVLGFHEGVEITQPADEDMQGSTTPWSDEHQVIIL
jgi:hypothetical protein